MIALCLTGALQYIDILTANRFKNLAMRVICDKVPEDDSAAAEFIAKLKKIPCLHFKKMPGAAANSTEPPEALPAEVAKD